MPRVVAADAARALQDPDPVVRGEAALIVAGDSDPGFHNAIVALAQDADPEARLRGIVALGLQATPGTAFVLERLLADHRDRVEPEGVAAAFALGLLPPTVAPVATSDLLASFQQSNLRRQRDALLALLLGMARHDQRPQTAALRRIFDDEATRDPDVRAQLLRILLRADHSVDGRQMRRILERGSPEERATLLRWLGEEGSTTDEELVAELQRLARTPGSAEQRAAALAALTRLHHVPSLEIAARALRSREAVECGQGLRSVLAIGGASMRRAVDQHVLGETDPACKAALLANYNAPPSVELAEQCARLAADAGQPAPLRNEAVLLLARTDPARAGPLLRDLFRETSQAASLDGLAAALLRTDGEPPPLSRLLDGPTDLFQHPDRWAALLAAEHPEAIRQLLAGIERPAPTALRRALALQLWRRMMVIRTPRPATGAAPGVLVALLGL